MRRIKQTSKTKQKKSKNKRADKARDKLTKGFGVNLAKTPFEQITHESGYCMANFFYVLFLLCFVHVTSSQVTYSVVVCTFL